MYSYKFHKKVVEYFDKRGKSYTVLFAERLKKESGFTITYKSCFGSVARFYEKPLPAWCLNCIAFSLYFM